MTDSLKKRRYAGPTLQELRQGDKIPAVLPGKNKPPHKRLKVYTLEARWVTTQTHIVRRRYTTKANLEAAKGLLLRDVASKNGMWWYWGREGERAVTTGPEFTETLDDFG